MLGLSLRLVVGILLASTSCGRPDISYGLRELSPSASKIAAVKGYHWSQMTVRSGVVGQNKPEREPAVWHEVCDPYEFSVSGVRWVDDTHLEFRGSVSSGSKLPEPVYIKEVDVHVKFWRENWDDAQKR